MGREKERARERTEARRRNMCKRARVTPSHLRVRTPGWMGEGQGDSESIDVDMEKRGEGVDQNLSHHVSIQPTPRLTES